MSSRSKCLMSENACSRSSVCFVRYFRNWNLVSRQICSEIWDLSWLSLQVLRLRRNLCNNGESQAFATVSHHFRRTRLQWPLLDFPDLANYLWRRCWNLPSSSTCTDPNQHVPSDDVSYLAALSVVITHNIGPRDGPNLNLIHLYFVQTRHKIPVALNNSQ